jgi:hypothetical protein
MLWLWRRALSAVPCDIYFVVVWCLQAVRSAIAASGIFELKGFRDSVIFR